MYTNRWYDKSSTTQDAINLLRHLDLKSQKIISQDIVNIANSIKTIRKEEDNLPISIGVKRVLGLYQSQNNRRWYDKSSHLGNAFKTISTLPDEDFFNIMEGICSSAK